MKILSIINPVKFGGGEKLIIDQAVFLKSEGIEYKVLNLNRSYEFENKLKENNIEFFNISNIELKSTPSKKDYLLLYFKLLPFIFKLRRYILKEKPDAIFVHGFPASFLTIQSLYLNKKKPKLFYFHHFMKGKEKPFIKKIYYLFLKNYDKIITVSSLTYKTFIQEFPLLKEKIIVLPNAIDTSKFEISISKKELREKLNLKQDSIIGINIGRLTKVKNQSFLIKLAEKINLESFQILIIGEGDEYENLKKLIEEKKLQNRVLLLGYIKQDEIPLYLNASDIFLFPSLKEGFGIAVIEAMAAGLPIVIFEDIYIKEFGEDIFVAKSEDEFINITSQLIKNQNLRQDVGRKAKEFVRRNLDIKVMGAKLLNIIKEK